MHLLPHQYEKRSTSLQKSTFVFISTVVSLLIIHAITNTQPLAFITVATPFMLGNVFFHDIIGKAFERVMGPVISIGLTALILFAVPSPTVGWILTLSIAIIFGLLSANGLFSYTFGILNVVLLLSVYTGYTQSISAAMWLSAHAALYFFIGGMSIVTVYAIALFHHPKTIWEFFLISLRLAARHLPNLQFTGREMAISIRYLIPPVLVLAINSIFHITLLNFQAVIASVIVVVQPALGKAVTRAWQRLTGIGLGFVLAIIVYPLCDLSVWIETLVLILLLTACTFLNYIKPNMGYIFIQAGLLLSMVYTLPVYQFNEAIIRAIGSVEGLLVAVIIYVITNILVTYLHKKTQS